MERLGDLSSKAKSSLIVGGTILLMGVSWLLTRPKQKKDGAKEDGKRKQGEGGKKLKSTDMTDSSCYSEHYDNFSAEMRVDKRGGRSDLKKRKRKVFLTDNEDLSSVNENFNEIKEQFHNRLYNSSSVLFE